jgi:hypothetical protein
MLLWLAILVGTLHSNVIVRKVKSCVSGIRVQISDSTDTYDHIDTVYAHANIESFIRLETAL